MVVIVCAVGYCVVRLRTSVSFEDSGLILLIEKILKTYALAAILGLESIMDSRRLVIEQTAMRVDICFGLSGAWFSEAIVFGTF